MALRVGRQDKAYISTASGGPASWISSETIRIDIQLVFIEGDSYGYDILSYTVLPDGSVKELYIEVKATTSKVDTVFYVSRNEVEKSNIYADRYCVYRIYDANSMSPKFYKAFGRIEDNFILDPITYMARYKGLDAA